MRSDHWSLAAADCHNAGIPYVIATVMATAGSTPRDSGSKLLVTRTDSFDSIGGGRLEFLVIEQARKILEQPGEQQQVRQFPLAAEAGQCCGGSVAILLESFVPEQRPVVLFGAGHVAQALARILPEAGFRLLCVDSRAELLSELPAHPALDTRCSPDPVAEIGALGGNPGVLVMTHDHQLDFELVCMLLRNWRWHSVGLIGSATKAQRFRHRLQRAGLPEELIARLQCPVGLAELKGKRPMEVAVSIAADLMQRQPEPEVHRTSWRDMRRALAEAEAGSSEGPD